MRRERRKVEEKVGKRRGRGHNRPTDVPHGSPGRGSLSPSSAGSASRGEGAGSCCTAPPAW